MTTRHDDHDTLSAAVPLAGPRQPQAVELYPPTDEDGWYASQVCDWVAVCPELGDPAVRLC
ncbi:hypothetical protein [Streptomyces sp. NRRL F-5727]|uniref:hypothetical protein n=1 Tax=Streptomyces sp. NRRL F-5727 TaxID=1463871 RepID=UPI0004CC64D5|nr:hypothetical protein [Streptomyces sp. NRRL F-5727]